jgi:DNA polymerase
LRIAHWKDSRSRFANAMAQAFIITDAAAPLPEGERSLAAVRRQADNCQACPLWEHATQAVFGEGPAHAPVMLVGEQPGDREDIEGRPFVGPAGRLLDKALAEAGVDRGKVYVTNAVKHFKFLQRGKQRLHAKPGSGEIQACRPWLERERRLVNSKVVVAMGATAVRGVFGKSLPIGVNRGTLRELAPGTAGLVTIHPSFLLRLSHDSDRMVAETANFVADLRLLVPFLNASKAA